MPAKKKNRPYDKKSFFTPRYTYADKIWASYARKTCSFKMALLEVVSQQ